MKAEKVLSLLAKEGTAFDLVYLDPPYRRQENERIAQRLSDEGLLKPDAVVVMESLKEEQFSETIGRLVRYKEAVYGISRISYYKMAKE